jgi:CRISPR/Cas system-associated endonuclease/helicase Cas3
MTILRNRLKRHFSLRPLINGFEKEDRLIEIDPLYILKTSESYEGLLREKDTSTTSFFKLLLEFCNCLGHQKKWRYHES